MAEFDKICKRLVNENLESILEKAYSIILFTTHYVIKLFNKNNKGYYNLDAIRSEYLWDKSMPFLEAKLIEAIKVGNSETEAIVMKRIPKSSNLLYNLISRSLTEEDIQKLNKSLLDTINLYPQIEIAADELYINYISNLNIQIKALNKELSMDLINRLVNFSTKTSIQSLFNEISTICKPALVHGNLFSGNTFYHDNQLIIIDPISYNHLARKSFPHMDMATHLVDIRLFGDKNLFSNTYQDISIGMRRIELVLLNIYYLLKLLVRIRFAYMEQKLEDSYSKFDINQMIIQKSNKIIESELERIICCLTDM